MDTDDGRRVPARADDAPAGHSETTLPRAATRGQTYLFRHRRCACRRAGVRGPGDRRVPGNGDERQCLGGIATHGLRGLCDGTQAGYSPSRVSRGLTAGRQISRNTPDACTHGWPQQPCPGPHARLRLRPGDAAGVRVSAGGSAPRLRPSGHPRRHGTGNGRAATRAPVRGAPGAAGRSPGCGPAAESGLLSQRRQPCGQRRSSRCRKPARRGGKDHAHCPDP